MKKLKLFLPALLLTLLANSQAGQINQINIISFSVKPVLPGNIDSWMSTPGALIMVAQKVPNPRMVEPRLVIQIRSGSAVICGNNAATAKQVDPFDVRTFNTADLTGFLSNCHELKAGTYTICAQFFNIDKVAISREVCKDFRVEEVNVEYTPPTLITPDNGKKFTAQELLGVVMFRWTPLVPKPKEPVTYRIKVWQLMQGQNGTQAMRTNQPIVTKDVDNITQATVSGIYTGPCRPPYLCDYIWNVQALNRSGKPMGNNNGMSEPYTFGLAEEKTKGPDNLFPEDKKIFTLADVKKPVTFKWRHISPTPAEPFTYRLRVWQLMQGQTISNAMNSTKPLLDIDGNGTVDALTDGLMILRYLETGPCKPPYLCDFVWNVEASTRQPGAAPKVIGTSEPTTFSVNESNSPVTIKNVFPEDNKSFSFELFFDGYEANRAVTKPLTFTWTAVTPKPQEPVTYRLKVWQLMQGQSGSQAMKTNQPIVTKDVADITEVTISSIYTGPCRPPYLCDFIWEVQAITRTGTTVGTSNPTEFSVKESQITGPENTFPGDKKEFTSGEAGKPITFRWTPITPKPQEPVTYRMKVWQLMQGQNASSAMKTNQPIVTKDVADITEASVSNIYTGPCKPPYICVYVWSVEAITRQAGAASKTIGTSHPTEFNVKETQVNCPDNVFPEDKKRFSLSQAKEPITFKWTKRIVTGEVVNYRLKVWQLMQGQNGTQAMKSNTPIVTKEVRNANEVAVTNLLTGPCRPPYLCDFIWRVEAIDARGQTTCSSTPTMFFVSQYIIQLDSIKVLCTSAPGVYSFSYTISNVNPGTANLTNFAITTSVPAGATMGSFLPPLGTSIGSGNQLTITGTINAAPNLSNICIGAEITDAANSFWKASKDTCVKVEPCRCDACDEKNFVMKLPAPGQITTTNNSISFNQSITITTTPPKTIKSIKAELVYFEMKPENDLCIPCDKDASLYGHFTNGTNSQQWNGPQTSLSINITTPITPCCSTLFRWCIRYKVEFTDCTVCTKLICYEKKKTGCAPTGGGGDNPNINLPK